MQDAGGRDKAFNFHPCPLHPTYCILDNHARI
jgi:hypothetical protein